MRRWIGWTCGLLNRGSESVCPQHDRRVEVHVGEARGFGQTVRDVDAEAVDTAVEPEAQRLLEVGDDLWGCRSSRRAVRGEQV